MTLKEQIAQMQREIEQWQKDPSGSAAMKRQLQALQSELDNLVKRTRPADRRRPRLAVVKPTPPPQVALSADERAVWSSFLSFHKALLQYSGWVNRDQWLQMADVAADMTSGNPELSFPFPCGVGGIWVWDGATQSAVRAPGLPFPTRSGVWGWNAGNQRWVLIEGGVDVEEAPSTGLTYGRRNGLWVPVQAATGVTDGSNAPTGQAGEFLTNQSNGVTFLTVGPGAGNQDTDYSQANALTLSAGDWEVGGGIDMWVTPPALVQEFWAYLGSGAPGWSQTDTQVDRGWVGTVNSSGAGTSFSVSLGPIRLNTTTPTQVIIGTFIRTDPSPGISATADSAVWARRVR